VQQSTKAASRHTNSYRRNPLIQAHKGSWDQLHLGCRHGQNAASFLTPEANKPCIKNDTNRPIARFPPVLLSFRDRASCKLLAKSSHVYLRGRFMVVFSVVIPELPVTIVFISFPFLFVAFNTTFLAHRDAVWIGRQPNHSMGPERTG
jgi:hypothetical protein